MQSWMIGMVSGVIVTGFLPLLPPGYAAALLVFTGVALLALSSLFARFAAGMAIGFWSGAEELRKNWTVDKTWQPAMEPDIRKKYYREWKKAVDRTFNWVD